MPTVSEILGRADPRGRTSRLYAEVEDALYDRSQDPAVVLQAAQVRFAKYMLRRIATRSRPEAPVLWSLFDGRAEIVPVADTKAFLLREWKDAMGHFGCASGGVTSTHVLDIIGYMRNWVVPLCGVCVLGMHTESGESRTMTYFELGDEAALELAERVIQEHAPVPQEYLDEALLLVGHCSQHTRLSCPECGIVYAADDMSVTEMLGRLRGGCTVCEHQEWLSQATPATYKPTVLKNWLAATRQFVQLL